LTRTFEYVTLDRVKVIAQVKLNPTPEQHATLLATLQRANQTCDTISAVAWQAAELRRYPLQRLVYHDLRESTGLGAQLLLRCIAKVAHAYKLDRKIQRTFQPYGAIAFDDRILSWFTDQRAVSISTLNGRQYIPFSAGDRQIALLVYRQGESHLVYQRGAFYLLAVCDLPEPDEQTIEGVLGVDLGIINLATDSDGASHAGDQIECRRQWYATRRQVLQKVGTRSAKRRLRQLKGRQRRFQKDTNHVISKRLVQKAKGTHRAIALEDLTHIRSRTTVRKSGRARHSNWAFRQLRQFVSYKATLAGVPVILVDPRHTSQRCSACGQTERRNRKSQAEFCCVVCGHALPADYNAAINIEQAALSAGLCCTAPLVGVETQAGYPLGAA
jgi:putative transposase